MTLYTQVDSNIRKTWFLITVFLILIIALGWVFSYIFESYLILYAAVIFSIFWSFSSYWYSDKIVLALTKSKPIKKENKSRIIQNCGKSFYYSWIANTKDYIINDISPNAFVHWQGC